MYNEYSAVVFFQMMIIAALVLKQRGEARKIIAFVFAFAVLAHYWLFEALHKSDSWLGWFANDNPITYYLGAVVACLFVLEVTARMDNPPELASEIQYIAVTAICFNLIGWLMEVSNVANHQFINSAFFMLTYGMAIVYLSLGEPKHDGHTRLDTRLYTVHSGNMARHITN